MLTFTRREIKARLRKARQGDKMDVENALYILEMIIDNKLKIMELEKPDNSI